MPDEIREVLGKYIDQFERRLEDAPPDDRLDEVEEFLRDEGLLENAAARVSLWRPIV